MIGWFLRFLLLRPSGLTMLGVLIIGLGVFVTRLGYEDLPQRAALKQVSGLLDRVLEITSRRGNSVKYELEIKTTDGELVRLTLPEREISQEQVRSLLGRDIFAMYNGTKDVWELASGDMKIIDYELTRQRRKETRAIEAEFGPYVAGSGLLVSLFGVLWLFRRRRTAITA
jgi:hypothetical protein